MRPTDISKVDFDSTRTGPAGEWLPAPIVVIVRERDNSSLLEGAPGTWTLDSDNPSSDTDTSIGATATAARPAEVRVDSFRRDSGADQRIVTKQSSTDPLIVTVLDDYNEPLRGAQVNFSVEPK